MSDEKVDIATMVRRGFARGACPVCRWSTEWMQTDTAHNRAKIVSAVDRHLRVVHGRAPMRP